MIKYMNNILHSFPNDYSRFLKFLETYASSGFNGINRNDPFIIELEEFTEQNNQFFIAGDVISMNFPFSSRRSLEMIGVEPSEISLYHLFQATHPIDMARHSRIRAQLLKIVQELYSAKKGSYLVSSNFLTANPKGSYDNILKQAYLFYTDHPYNTVFIFLLHTNINWFRRKEGFHYYAGQDMSYFRLPDEKLLMVGPSFSQRELEIIRLLESGMSSDQIGEKLFISPHTVNTHRRNLLRKTGKANTADLVFSLQEQGVI
jgi:DNA-binding CsgD family transcriptional regulator